MDEKSSGSLVEDLATLSRFSGVYGIIDFIQF